MLRLRNSVQGNNIETLIFGLWKINIINLVKSKAILAKEYSIQPSEIDNMLMWEYELFLEEIKDLVKESNEQSKKQMEDSKYKPPKMPKYNSSPPKMPRIPKMPRM